MATVYTFPRCFLIKIQFKIKFDQCEKVKPPQMNTHKMKKTHTKLTCI